jgi:hypothetical protein
MILEINQEYIFESLDKINVIKGKVLEVTQTTYYIKWENGFTERYLIKDFKYKIIEKINSNIPEIKIFNPYKEILKNFSITNKIQCCCPCHWSDQSLSHHHKPCCK